MDSIKCSLLIIFILLASALLLFCLHYQKVMDLQDRRLKTPNEHLEKLQNLSHKIEKLRDEITEKDGRHAAEITKLTNNISILMDIINSQKKTISKKEAAIVESCKVVFGSEWEGTLRDDGSVMCIKFETKVPGCSYGGMVKACQKYEATVAPIASQEEQNAIMRILDSLPNTIVTSRGIWIGAQKMEPYNASGNAARYRWDYDGKEAFFFNWGNTESEPNNVQHNEPEANNVKDEKCIYVNRDGTWWDNHCEGSIASGGYFCQGTTDGFCAKPFKKTTKPKS